MLESRYMQAKPSVDPRMEQQLTPKLNRLLGRSFKADRRAPGAARNALGSLHASIDPELAEDVRLLVSELVTNSLRHTGSSDIELEVWCSEQLVRVAVSDRGAGFELAGAPRPGDASGWGLFMVDRLADRWGIETDGATCVWFELARPVATGAAA